MRELLRNEKGFTLIETVLILSIVMVITSSIVFVSTSKLVEAEEKRFFRQFHLDIQKLQSIGIAENKLTNLSFEENGSKYVGKWRDTRLFEHKLPKNIRLNSGSTLLGVSFHPNGTVSQFGTFFFETSKGEKTVTIYIGGGRVNYEE